MHHVIRLLKGVNATLYEVRLGDQWIGYINESDVGKDSVILKLVSDVLGTKFEECDDYTIIMYDVVLVRTVVKDKGLRNIPTVTRV